MSRQGVGWMAYVAMVWILGICGCNQGAGQGSAQPQDISPAVTSGETPPAEKAVPPPASR